MSRTKQEIDLAIERRDRPGTYRRRLNDAFAALELIKIEKLSAEIAFVFYLLTCEKVAKVMVGIDRGRPGSRAGFRKAAVRPEAVTKAVRKLGCLSVISDEKIRLIFANDEKKNRFSGYSLRTRLFHDFGPSHVKELTEHAPKLNAAMKQFLKCRGPIISFLDSSQS